LKSCCHRRVETSEVAAALRRDWKSADRASFFSSVFAHLRNTHAFLADPCHQV